MTGVERFSLAGKNVLLTGSGGAIGSLIAVEVAAAGARVALQDLTEDKVSGPAATVRAAGGDAFTLAADLSDAAVCSGVVARAAELLGGIDVLINCAGINRRKPIDDVSIDDFDAIVAVNMRAVFFLSQAVHPFLTARGGGAIVNLSSLSARHSYRTISVYGATKAAVTGMTRSFAREWAADGIRVNCVEPAVVQTEFTKPLWDDPDRSRWFAEHSPLGRLARPEEIVGAVIFLAGDASSYITGQSIVIDGGITSGADWDAWQSR
jgi:gluconate 5-dehydrogenase